RSRMKQWFGSAVALVFLFLADAGSAADWVRAGLNTNAPVWGIRGGLLWAIPPGGFLRGEPRGLIRLGYPTLTNAAYDLINFIAIEPIVKGNRGLSELERSELDHLPGKRLWAVATEAAETKDAPLVEGRLSQKSKGVEQLD